MNRSDLHMRKAGSGPFVLCLHSSGSSSKQWLQLMDSLAGRYTVISPDLIGYGKSAELKKDEPLTLDDEIDRLRPLLDSIPGPFHLVGHSYGAAVAFKVCFQYSTRVRSLVVYEPVLFNLLFEAGDLDAAEDIWIVQDDVHWLLADGRFTDAARRFINYWSGDGEWDRLLDWQQAAIEKRMRKVGSDFDAVLASETRLSDYQQLKMPVLYLYGVQSPLSTRRVAEFVSRQLPNVEVRGLLPAGHMGPMTHTDEIQKIIINFIRKQPAGILPHQVTIRGS